MGLTSPTFHCHHIIISTLSCHHHQQKQVSIKKKNSNPNHNHHIFLLRRTVWRIIENLIILHLEMSPRRLSFKLTGNDESFLCFSLTIFSKLFCFILINLLLLMFLMFYLLFLLVQRVQGIVRNEKYTLLGTPIETFRPHNLPIWSLCYIFVQTFWLWS